MLDFYKVTRGGYTHLFFQDVGECLVFARTTLEPMGIAYTRCGLQITIEGEASWLNLLANDGKLVGIRP